MYIYIVGPDLGANRLQRLSTAYLSVGKEHSIH